MNMNHCRQDTVFATSGRWWFSSYGAAVIEVKAQHKRRCKPLNDAQIAVRPAPSRRRRVMRTPQETAIYNGSHKLAAN